MSGDILQVMILHTMPSQRIACDWKEQCVQGVVLSFL